ncbi:ATP-dependent helicase IRC3 [Pseudoalteromonas citrea]|uniref:ATP-dependent helicase IRC3 n=2 Tax=Pseudoalteromonas citrea TaxID=43655 RepID=A0AAD4AEE2_9GAMM|nr:DEAD/DEAH box helicase [Pseudoalteromonas citrea]KAF7764410.1 ATP-dependent helicase IRC3 [Pseudoalteromonas citrea]
MEQIGIYEQLITQVVEQNLNRERFYVGERVLESAEAATWLSRFLAKLVEQAINAIPNSNERLQHQIELANKLVFWLKDHITDDTVISDNLIDSQGKILTALFDKSNPIAADLPTYTNGIFPLTGLTQSELFSGANAGISLETELKREINSADTIYWLVSFIKWTGLRIFKNELEAFTHSGKQLKVITTSYMGATDAKAVEFLAGLPNTEVKLSYNNQQERLHAKSYLFLRNTGFHTGYIGSSNLSHSALTSGLEWNLKITAQEIPHIIAKTKSTFETYWQSKDFELFTGKVACKEKLINSLKEQRGVRQPNNPLYFDIAPKPHQKVILEKLCVERSVHNRYKNLVVAATGTGKTIVSAFDFKPLYDENPSATFLFIAHREEILKQAQSAYRGVLKNNNFGELWVGNYTPERYNQLFASIQTLNNQLATLQLTSDYYDYIVIDEVHHVSATSYRAVLQHFTPTILLGLTATPERQDGANILEDFCGVIAAEIRLPEAINQRHLCPFQYFGIDDTLDLNQIPWRNGRYDIAELSNLYTGENSRAAKIITSLADIATNVHTIKALAFCVSQAHAEFMAAKFNLAGINADVLTSKNTRERAQKQQALRSGAIQILCVVDIFNEGVDIPEVDTLLFLRPTESLTLFLQQLGRGLRLPDNSLSLSGSKQCCTVLDFVGNARPEYDFASKFRSLIGKSNQPIKTEIENNFPHLPLGCRIELQKQTQKTILKNIQQAINGKRRLQQLIAGYSQHSDDELSLSNFLRLNPQVTLEDIYKPKDKKLGGWHWLKGDDIPEEQADIYAAYYRAINTQLLTCDSLSYLRFLQELCNNNFNFSPTPQNQQFALMAHYNFWDNTGKSLGFNTLDQGLKALKHTMLQHELAQVITLLINRIHQQESDLACFPNHAIKLHSRYTRQHILAAFGAHTFDKKSTAREGVLEFKNQNLELLFVTLNKCEKTYSPTTLYHDYALSPTLFHWQTQNSARPEHGRGLSYIEHQQAGKTFLLFVREQSKDENGRTMGFVNYGEVKYQSHTGSQPMNVTWELMNPMPSDMWHEAGKLAVG